MPWFCYLLEKMANDVHARVGSYSHIAHSMHLYESDFKTALDMLGDKGENYD